MAVSMDKGLQNSASQSSRFVIFIKDVRDRQGRKRQIMCRSWYTIAEVKNSLHKAIGVPPRAQNLFYGPLLGVSLPNYRSLADLGIYKDGATLLLDIGNGASSISGSSEFTPSLYTLMSAATKDVCLSPSVIEYTPKFLRLIVQRTRRALALGIKPEFALDGSGGTYFLHNTQKARIAVFKPADEEPYAPNNPRGYLRQPGQPTSFREGIAPGEACIREVAAYVLDHKSFGNVPMTTIVEAIHPSFNTNGSRLKLSEGGASLGLHSLDAGSTQSSILEKKVGSFQEYVRCDCTMDDLSPSKLSTDAVHRIAILDIRILNADRNAANLLCRRRRDMQGFELVPIDHGFCLRTVADNSWMDWCWLDWPQLKKPMSEASKKYIISLDIEADAKLLKERLNICEEAIDLFRVANSCLKYGVKAGLSLYEIAIMCCRNDDMGEEPSSLERMFQMATELSVRVIDNDKWDHAASAQALAEQISPVAQPLPWRKGNKSFSAANLPKTLTDLEKNPTVADKVPSMIQSTASDSSSDNGDKNSENCEEWAATLVEDLSLDLQNGFNASRRSISLVDFESTDREDTSSPLSSSPPGSGFWHVRPGSPILESPCEDDFGHFDTLSQEGSSDSERDVQTSVPEQEENSSPMPLSSLPTAIIDHQSPLKKHANVAFADSDSLAKSPSQATSSQKKLGFMKRSQSYSALSDSRSFASTAPLPKPSSSSASRRKYFFKFVALLLQRETAAISSEKSIRK